MDFVDMLKILKHFQAVLACSVAVALGAWNGPLAGGVPAHQYPAGVSPQACPNFPHCSNPALAANPDAPAPIYNQNAYNQNAYNPGPYAQHQGGVGDAHFTGAYSPQGSAESGQYTGDGDYKGEGLPESGAYGPHCKNNYIQYNSNKMLNINVTFQLLGIMTTTLLHNGMQVIINGTAHQHGTHNQLMLMLNQPKYQPELMLTLALTTHSAIKIDSQLTICCHVQ